VSTDPGLTPKRGISIETFQLFNWSVPRVRIVTSHSL
jgi:hypothetical protein